MKYTVLLCLALICLFATGCASKKIKDIAYFKQGETTVPALNVFVPRKRKPEKLPVLIFVHGGNWNTGSKDTYGFLGRNFAKKGVITIIPDYTLSPAASYDGMAHEIAASIQWAKQHIAQYGGDTNRIFITGHSAGGHLAALAVMNPKYGISPKSISGIILNDAAGLDMKHYLEENPPQQSNNYTTTWTTDPDNWHDASPIYFLDKDTPPLLIYVGDKTYGSIKVANQRFLEALKPYQPKVVPIHLNKKHVPMVTQYFWPFNKRYKEIKDFIESH
ncbi:alpha/beta hydrolase [Flavobacterium zepuense]|uniref:Alpha/beta hydrolase n=1 Tax=Flavobacterium zepuense TaxID=2593302 RepID=A0A552V463_9FLAO|nr:alpha/beta hydrolase [Flavobacterium zepuense]TRW25242.1 alpha/beta hydrolase [Flavobacterium zepuense]